MFNILDERCDDIRSFMEYNEDDIRANVIKRVNNFIDRLETDTLYNKKKIRELKVFIYDKTKNVKVSKLNNMLSN